MNKGKYSNIFQNFFVRLFEHICQYVKVENHSSIEKYWENYSPPYYSFLSVVLRSWAFIEEVSGFKFQEPNMWIILQHNILLQEEANVLSKVSNSMVESCVIRRQVIYWKNVSLSYLTSFIKPNIIGNYQFTLILFHTTFYITVFKSQLIVTTYHP